MCAHFRIVKECYCQKKSNRGLKKVTESLAVRSFFRTLCPLKTWVSCHRTKLIQFQAEFTGNKKPRTERLETLSFLWQSAMLFVGSPSQHGHCINLIWKTICGCHHIIDPPLIMGRLWSVCIYMWWIAAWRTWQNLLVHQPQNASNKFLRWSEWIFCQVCLKNWARSAKNCQNGRFWVQNPISVNLATI